VSFSFGYSGCAVYINGGGGPTSCSAMSLAAMSQAAIQQLTRKLLILFYLYFTRLSNYMTITVLVLEIDDIQRLVIVYLFSQKKTIHSEFFKNNGFLYVQNFAMISLIQAKL
jgi:hypothetical protein